MTDLLCTAFVWCIEHDNTIVGMITALAFVELVREYHQFAKANQGNKKAAKHWNA